MASPASEPEPMIKFNTPADAGFFKKFDDAHTCAGVNVAG